MLKRQWIDLILDYLNGGAENTDLISRYHPTIIEKYIELAYSQIIDGVYKKAEKYREFGSTDNYTKAFKNVQVKYDQDRDEYYSEIPASYIQLTMNRGVKQISPMQDQKTKFVYRDNNTTDIYSELDVSKVMNYITFYIENTKVYYSNYNTIYNKPGLLFKLICPLSEFADDDELGLPANSSMTIFQMVVELLSKKPPEKNITDNTSKSL